MTVSVIIPSYNDADVLDLSLATWMNQTLQPSNYEVIVVDNNSTDETRAVVMKYEREMTNLRYHLETTPGATAARHAGVRLAKGKYLVFADNDGLYNAACLSSILDMYRVFQDIAAVACRIVLRWDGDEPEWIAPYRFMYGALDYGDKPAISSDYYFNGGLFSMPKAVFEMLGGFNPDLMGGFLIGDGDTGLVNKVHAAGLMIGWCPDAVMQHMQRVSTHGSEQGLGRHFYNTGVSRSYGLFRAADFKVNMGLAIYIIKSSIALLKRTVLSYGISKRREDYFSKMQRKGELSFFRYLLNKELRHEICKKNCYQI